MPWNDPTETVVAGSGQVYIAATGTALPSKTSEAINASFNGLGYHTEDGVSITPQVNITEYKAWQSKSAIRREQDSRDFLITFSLLQHNEINLPFAFGGGAITEPSTGQFKYSPPEDTAALDERSLILDVDDGNRRSRIIVPRGTVTETNEVAFKRTEMAGLAVTFKALVPTSGGLPWYALFNDSAAFAVGS